jgi:hypothetical protein
MFYATWIENTKNSNIETLKFPKPIGRLGYHKDIADKLWDVNAIIRDTIFARPVDYSNPYYSTSTNASASSAGYHKWHSYKVKVIKKENNNDKSNQS